MMTQVLIVDDELGIRSLLGEILEDDGCSVVMAENASEAHQAVKNYNFDLILLDIWMPGTDGITLLKEWHASRLLRCPVIIMSGHASIETAMEATRFGAADFLEKPISQRTLLDTCHRTLRDWRNKIFDSNLIPVVAQEIAEKTDTPTDEVTPMGHVTRSMPQTNVVTGGVVHLPPYSFESGAPMPALTIPLMGLTIDFNQSFRIARDNFERAYLSRVLMMKNGSVSELSNHSGLERTHLYRKLRNLGIDPVTFKNLNPTKSEVPVYGPSEDEIRMFTLPGAPGFDGN